MVAIGLFLAPTFGGGRLRGYGAPQASFQVQNSVLQRADGSLGPIIDRKLSKQALDLNSRSKILTTSVF
jgi:hypothetical protein